MSDELAGLRIVVPRGGPAGERAAAAIRVRGAVPIYVPLIDTVPPADAAGLRVATARFRAGAFDWLVVTSAAGAAAVAAAGITDASVTGRGSARGIAAVGPATVSELAAHGLTAALRPAQEFTGAALGAALVSELAAHAAHPARVLLALAEAAGDDVEHALRAAGHETLRVSAYRTVATPPDPGTDAALVATGADAVLITSGSVARAFDARFPVSPPGARLVAIGPPTAAVLAELGRPADVVATRHTIPGMLTALAAQAAPTVPAGSGTPTPGAPA